MDKSEILEKLRHILVSVLKHEKFEMRDDLSATDVDGWDSLTHMIIITEIEKMFNCRFKLKELNKLGNMGTLIELIQSKL
ncbi:MAG: acyl carrier protein [Bacteroidales bacterium]|nr:acyl carrier protein [Bacteroidales bacterium]